MAVSLADLSPAKDGQYARWDDASKLWLLRSAATTRVDLELQPGSQVQVYDQGLTEIAALANVAGDILYTNATPAWARLPKGSNGQALTLVAGLPAWATKRGIVSVVSSTTSAVSTTTTQIPWDDTIPQSTEGGFVTSLSHAPAAATNLLMVIGWVFVYSTVTAYVAATLIRSDSVNARAAETFMTPGEIVTPCVIQPFFAAGAVTARTWTLRVGLDRAGTATINGIGGGRRYGTTPKSGLLLIEIEP